MIKKLKIESSNEDEDMDNVCEECNENDESVLQNLILTGFKICKSCRISKTVFPF